MRDEYKRFNKTKTVMLPNADADEWDELLAARSITGAQFIRMALHLLRAGVFDQFYDLPKGRKK